MSEIAYSGYNYPPEFIFPDRINIPREFEITEYDDNELLNFRTDQFGRFSIIELSKSPYIKYEYFNWDYKGQDSKYKWFYIAPSGRTVYRLYPSGSRVPLDSGGASYWETPDVSSYIMHGTGSMINYSGYFSKDTFVRNDMLTNPTGWIRQNDPFPFFGDTEKIKYETLLKYQYKPVKLFIGIERTDTTDTIEAADVTNYKQNRTPILDQNAVNSVQALQFYFDGRNLITNYNFSDVTTQRSVHAIYEFSIDKIKVASKLYTNKRGKSDYTPIMDNYILKISTQRINR